ncbi:MAG: hypothetical protein V8R26_00925 [Clostridia bacterium]
MILEGKVIEGMGIAKNICKYDERSVLPKNKYETIPRYTKY